MVRLSSVLVGGFGPACTAAYAPVGYVLCCARGGFPGDPKRQSIGLVRLVDKGASITGLAPCCEVRDKPLSDWWIKEHR
jgi:hypothetical protein